MRLPSLEEPEPGAVCECGEPMRIIGFCARCYEEDLLRAAAEADSHSSDVEPAVEVR